MLKQICQECLIGDDCPYENKLSCCEYYCSTEVDDEILDEYIEARRIRFYEEWFDYTRDDYE